MIEYLYSAIYTSIYVVLLNLFVGIFVPKRNKHTYLLHFYLAFSIFFNCAMSFLLLSHMALKQIVIIFANTIVIWLIFEVKLRKSFVLVILFQGSGIAIEYLTYVLLQNGFGLLAEDIENNDNLGFVMGLLCHIIMFSVISAIRKACSKKLGYLLTEMEWLRFSIFPLFCIITIVALITNFEFIDNSRQGFILIWIVSGLVVMNILVFSLLTDALKRENELSDYKVIQERGKSDTEMYQSMILNYNEQRKIVHEFKNHMECISSLIKNEEYERLKGYVLKMQETVSHEHDLMDTNNKLVNMILNAKYLEASKKNILIAVKANDLSDITLEDQDIVIILSNLINNAIEACERSNQKVIKLKIIRERKWFVISATNHYEREPLNVAGKFITSKLENVEYHGIGIENIKNVVDKYNGTCAIKCEDNIFQFSIILPV